MKAKVIFIEKKIINLTKKIQNGRLKKAHFPAEKANRAYSGQLQFWSEPSEILNVRSSSTPEPVAFTIP